MTGNESAESGSPELTAAQIESLQKLAKAGFNFVSIEHVTRYLPVEKNGFIALLDPTGGKLKIFGQAGYRMGQGIGMLTEQRGRKVFVWKHESVAATPELLSSFRQFRADLDALLETARPSNSQAGKNS